MTEVKFPIIPNVDKLQQLEDLFDNDVDYYPEHVKGDEEMTPISIGETYHLEPVESFAFTQDALRNKLHRKMNNQIKDVLEEYEPDFFKIGSYSFSRQKVLFGYKGTVESGMYFAKELR